MVSQTMYTVPSLHADDASMPIVTHITSVRHQKARRQEAQTMHGRTRLSSLSGSQCAPHRLHILSYLNFCPFSRLRWALPPRCCRCIRFQMHDIALRLPTLRKHEQKRGRLGTSDGLRFARVSLSSSEIKVVMKLRRSRYLGGFEHLTHKPYIIEYVRFSLSIDETTRTDAPVLERAHRSSMSGL
jgi:hypothetical protein